MAQSYQFGLRGISGLLAMSAIAGLTACGGGGGGGDDIPSECRSYCRTACAKIGVCNGFNERQIEECRETCVDVIAEDGGSTPQSCQNGIAFVANASCAELNRIVGLRTTDGSQVRMSQELVASDCGVALGLHLQDEASDE